MNQTVDIRLATRADVQVLVTLVQQYWRFEAIERFEAADMAGLLETLIAQPALGRAWLAGVDGAPAGYLLAVYVFSLEHKGITAEIDEFFVLPQHRRLGLGRRLLSQAEALFRENGCTNVSLQIGRDNAAARAFYRGHGYSDRAGFELVDKML
jgi:ribosomal protein S18 acetylase RimI-like enzyme